LSSLYKREAIVTGSSDGIGWRQKNNCRRRSNNCRFIGWCRNIGRSASSHWKF